MRPPFSCVRTWMWTWMRSSIDRFKVRWLVQPTGLEGWPDQRPFHFFHLQSKINDCCGGRARAGWMPVVWNKEAGCRVEGCKGGLGGGGNGDSGCTWKCNGKQTQDADATDGHNRWRKDGVSRTALHAAVRGRQLQESWAGGVRQGEQRVLLLAFLI